MRSFWTPRAGSFHGLVATRLKTSVLSAVFLSLVFGGVLTWFTPVSVQAASVASSYKASVISLDYTKSLKPGEVGQARIQFQNIGTSAWLKDGKNFTSLYRWNPRRKIELASAFTRSSWETASRAARIPSLRVNPGESVIVTFPLAAPLKPGVYREEFILAAENIAWIALSPVVLEVRVEGGAKSSVQISSGSVLPPLVTVAPSSVVPVTPVVPAAPSLPIGASADWQAELVSKGGVAWQLESGETGSMRFVFKNTGTRTWNRESSDYVSLYSVEGSRERNNPFAPKTGWLSRSHAVKMQESQVRPGETATFFFSILAPAAPGVYQEVFALAAENTAWISGGSLTIPISVPMTGEFMATGPVSNTDYPIAIVPSKQTPTGAYAGTFLLRSGQDIATKGGDQSTITLGFKNTGTATWNSRSIRFTSVTAGAGGGIPSLRDQSWNDGTEAISLLGVTKPGEIAFVSFTIRVPSQKGTYQATFQLQADQQLVTGAEVTLPITATTDTSVVAPRPVPSTPITNGSSSVNINKNNTPVASSAPSIVAVPLNGDTSSLPNEPVMRVGLFKGTNDELHIRAFQAPLQVLQGGSIVCRVSIGESTVIRYDRARSLYLLQGGSCQGQSSQLYVVRAEDGLSPMEVTDFTRPAGWLHTSNDDKFRTQLELRYTPATNAVWVINELPFEYYLRGIAETSNISPQEFQRTLLTAARTYGYYHIQRATKHANENYIIDATYDQVYRGYGQEMRAPNITAAVIATHAQIVTYDGKLAITPYFSRSDGRTRSWGEVWYGGSQYPWLISVPVPQDASRTLWGHGVGMSASGALDMANAGRTYDQILKYFYTGIEIRKAYK